MTFHLYQTPRWRKLRKQILKRDPLCVLCLRSGHDGVPATVADHVEPHGGDPVKFWAGPFQGLCATCHSGIKQKMEKSGCSSACDVSGLPLDPGHPWNRGK